MGMQRLVKGLSGHHFVAQGRQWIDFDDDHLGYATIPQDSFIKGNFYYK